MRLTVPDLISNSYFPAVAAVSPSAAALMEGYYKPCF